MTRFLPSDRILIYGFAKEGLSTLNYLRRNEIAQEITIADDKKLAEMGNEFQHALNNNGNLKLIDGNELFNNKDLNFDVIFITPGIPMYRVPNRLWPIITSQTKLFLEKYHSQTIGVTGTKGKGTTASLIFKILEDSGKKCMLLGNFGTPLLDYYGKIDKETIIIGEFSSYQLQLIKNSPHIALLINIFPEHLDYHGNFSSYLAAKANITKFQSRDDYLIINTQLPHLRKVASQSLAQVKPIVHPKSYWPTKLLGDFNQLNIAAAWEAVKLFGIDETTARKSVASFKPLEHRLEPIGAFRNLSFYDDSFATVPESTIFAMDTIGTQLETLITGGFDRGIKYTQLAKAIDDSTVKALILFPTTGQKILQALKRADLKVFETDSMENAVRLAYENTSNGKSVLLSCASPSFNLFRNFRDRGEQFKKWVVKLGKTSVKEV